MGKFIVLALTPFVAMMAYSSTVLIAEATGSEVPEDQFFIEESVDLAFSGE